MIANQRPKPPPAISDAAASNSITPRNRLIQPQVLRSLMMNFVLLAKKFALSMAPMPQMMLRIPPIDSRRAAKTVRPDPGSPDIERLLDRGSGAHRRRA